MPYVSNKVGINRIVWDLREDGPMQWMGAAKEDYRGPKTGPVVAPGTYTVHVTINGQTFAQSFDVKPDPRDAWAQADYQAAYAFAKRYSVRYGKVDEALNNMDAMKKSLFSASLLSSVSPALRDKIANARQERDTVFALFTADYHNDEDSIQRPGPA